MQVAKRHNRITAMLVALLYVFFSTFGAVAHTHPLMEQRNGTTSAALQGRHDAHVTHLLVPAERQCAACEWQAQSVTPPATPQAHAAAPLLSIIFSAPTYSHYIVCLARFASRGPPLA